ESVKIGMRYYNDRGRIEGDPLNEEVYEEVAEEHNDIVEVIGENILVGENEWDIELNDVMKNLIQQTEIAEDVVENVEDEDTEDECIDNRKCAPFFYIPTIPSSPLFNNNNHTSDDECGEIYDHTSDEEYRSDDCGDAREAGIHSYPIKPKVGDGDEDPDEEGQLRAVTARQEQRAKKLAIDCFQFQKDFPLHWVQDNYNNVCQGWGDNVVEGKDWERAKKLVQDELEFFERNINRMLTTSLDQITEIYNRSKQPGVKITSANELVILARIRASDPEGLHGVLSEFQSRHNLYLHPNLVTFRELMEDEWKLVDTLKSL
ncbi:hypothetical protein BGZ46_000746, partial [Entomortierella lignicola]